MNISYEETILKLIFSKFGAIKECIVFQEKRAAIIEFISLNSAVSIFYYYYLIQLKFF